MSGDNLDAFFNAAKIGYERVLEAVMIEGLDLNIIDVDGYNLLYYAVDSGNNKFTITFRFYPFFNGCQRLCIKPKFLSGLKKKVKIF